MLYHYKWASSTSGSSINIILLRRSVFIKICCFYVLFLVCNNSLISPHVDTEINTHVMFVCNMDGEVQWRFNGGNLCLNALAITEFNQFTVQISYVQFHDKGISECSGKVNGKYFVAYSTLWVFGMKQKWFIFVLKGIWAKGCGL